MTAVGQPVRSRPDVPVQQAPSARKRPLPEKVHP